MRPGSMTASSATSGFAVVFSMIAALTSTCSSERTPEQGARTEVSEEESAAAKTQRTSSVVRNYDVEGRLLPSDQYVAGVRLPRGCELFVESDLRHVYRVRAPIDKVLAYLGPMMITGNVERRGKGAIYKRASVRGAEMSPTKLDVSVLDVGSSMTRISITELPPPPSYVPSAEETKAKARDSWRTLD